MKDVNQYQGIVKKYQFHLSLLLLTKEKLIAKRAGVSKCGLYHYFPNKEILLMEANKKLSEPVMEMAEETWISFI